MPIVTKSARQLVCTSTLRYLLQRIIVREKRKHKKRHQTGILTRGAVCGAASTSFEYEHIRFLSMLTQVLGRPLASMSTMTSLPCAHLFSRNCHLCVRRHVAAFDNVPIGLVPKNTAAFILSAKSQRKWCGGSLFLSLRYPATQFGAIGDNHDRIEIPIGQNDDKDGLHHFHSHVTVTALSRCSIYLGIRSASLDVVRNAPPLIPDHPIYLPRFYGVCGACPCR